MQASQLQPDLDSDDQVPLARTVRDRSVEQWGEQQPTEIVGVDPTIENALHRVARFARSESPVMITGETGTGKELFARAVYLLSLRRGGPFLSINCAQYHEGQLIVSELFGHKRGSFTGALNDHKGIFESANGGVVFLDEVGELSLVTQAMLLRLLSEGEIVPVGESRCRRVDVRVVVATNRNLKAMVEQGTFRADLYYRLRCLHLVLPPLRERGGDWQLILEHHLNRLRAAHRMRKRFCDEALSALSRYPWPGNVREVRGLVDTAFHLSEGDVIRLGDFADALDEVARPKPRQATSTAIHAAALYVKLVERRGTFWSLVHEPYLDRDLKRTEVRALIRQGLAETRGSYKKLLEILGVGADDYLKFMDFLRHHNLKPDETPAASIEPLPLPRALTDEAK
jgi:transcriptional regulator with GAF, ATPase, and Fis domain